MTRPLKKRSLDVRIEDDAMDEDGEWVSAPPNPAALIESLRSLGYTPGSAIADLIDNSIAAGATRVEVRVHWSGADSWCAVVDDGWGMDASTLQNAMRFASTDPLATRRVDDLGRYGMGLKTASLSQCSEVTVQSRTGNGDASSVRSWDVEHVRAVDDWQLRTSAPHGTKPMLRELDTGRRGTVVLWRRLVELVEPEDRVDDEGAHARFLERIELIQQHLSMVFGRYLLRADSPLSIRINGIAVKGWDPFLETDTATQSVATECLQLNDAKVLVDAYVLPHRSKLSEHAYHEAAGPRGWTRQQGFYVYRLDRLIVSGDWLGLGFSSDDAHSLARISVDVPPSLDREWSLDIRKATVRPPAALRGDLRRLAKVTRERASRVFHHRGADVGKRNRRSIVPVWRQFRRRGELVFGINRDHPVIAHLLGTGDDRKQELNAVLDLIEETIPIPALPTQRTEPPRVLFNGRPPDAVIALAGRLYEAYLEQGMSRNEAAERVANCEPFDEYPDLMKAIWGET